jgi:hypothetical protein
MTETPKPFRNLGRSGNRPRALDYTLGKTVARYFLKVFLSALAAVFIFILLSLILPTVGNFFYDLVSGGKVIEQGSAYGVTIGRSKERTFQDLLDEYRNQNVFVSGAVIENAPTRFMLSDDNAYEIMMPEDHWHLFVPLMKLSVLRLHFTDGKLAKIIRVWAPSDLP